MQTFIIGARASSILYNFLASNKKSIGEGHFLLPANVCPIVPVTFLKAGVSFKFIDISLDDFCIDKSLLKEKLTVDPNIKGILFVRSFGYFENLETFFAELKNLRDDLILIDDRCICIPTFDPNEINSDADMTLFSTGYAKYVEFNKGGFAFKNDMYNFEALSGKFSEKDHEKLVAKMNETIVQNTPFQYQETNWLIFDHSFELKKYQRAIKEKIEEVNAHKSIINTIYANHLPEKIQAGQAFNTWRFNVFVDDKKKVLAKIFENDLFASSHYASVSHLFGGGQAKNANKLHSKILNLFNDYRFSEEMALKVCEIVNKNI